MIEVKGVSFAAGRRKLVDSVSFKVEPGKLLAVIGPNGAGKSTLLKLLTRELRPAQGEILFEGKPLGDYSHLELAKRRAVLAQQNKLSLPFDVREVVMMGRYPFHKSAPEDRDYEIVEECLKKVGMSEFSERVFTTLSGGEQQRVQLAKSIAQIWESEGGYLFLDEPTNGMDLRHQYHALSVARELARKGRGIIAVLHDLNMTLQYADEVLIMEKGKMKTRGKAGDVLTEENITSVFGVPVRLATLPDSQEIVIVPRPGL
jgi:iron complex transport system ATP-binding protein